MESSIRLIRAIGVATLLFAFFNLSISLYDMTHSAFQKGKAMEDVPYIISIILLMGISLFMTINNTMRFTIRSMFIMLLCIAISGFFCALMISFFLDFNKENVRSIAGFAFMIIGFSVLVFSEKKISSKKHCQHQ